MRPRTTDSCHLPHRQHLAVWRRRRVRRGVAGGHHLCLLPRRVGSTWRVCSTRAAARSWAGRRRHHACLAVARAFECAVQKQRPRPRCSTIRIATANTPAMPSVNCATSCELPEHEASGQLLRQRQSGELLGHTQGELIRIGASLRAPRQKSRFSGTSGLLQSDAAPRRARASLGRGLWKQFELNVHQPPRSDVSTLSGKDQTSFKVSPNGRETDPMQFFDNVYKGSPGWLPTNLRPASTPVFTSTPSSAEPRPCAAPSTKAPDAPRRQWLIEQRLRQRGRPF